MAEKEIKYRDDSGQEVTDKVDPKTLDKKMNEAETVYGVDGEDKDKAAYLAKEPGEKREEPITGERNS
ncbi:MAG TPA: hypothetical protein VNP73_11390 [Actinomycetota bacterium]|nr:hypothetical protein [Actinomycetota bacterium]